MSNIHDAGGQPPGNPLMVSIGPVPEWDHLGICSIIPGQRKLLVPSQDTDCVSIVDLNELRITATVRLDKGSAPWHVLATPDNKYVYVTNSLFHGHVDTSPKHDSTVSVIDLATATRVTDIRVGGAPVMIDMDSRRNRAYVTNRVSNTVSVIDTLRHQVIQHVKVGKSPFWVKLSPDGKLLVVGNFEDASLSVIDADTLNTLNTVTVGTPGLDSPFPEFGPGDTLGFTIDAHNRAFVANWRSHRVVVVDLLQTTTLGRRAVSVATTIPAKGPFTVELSDTANLLVVGTYDVKDSRIVVYDNDPASPHMSSVLANLPTDGTALPSGRAGEVNYWMSEPFENRIIGYLGGGLRMENPTDLVAAVL
jgi:YVTN family beta-propeller protein